MASKKAMFLPKFDAEISDNGDYRWGDKFLTYKKCHKRHPLRDKYYDQKLKRIFEQMTLSKITFLGARHS